jgi:hypothetical protein
LILRFQPRRKSRSSELEQCKAKWLFKAQWAGAHEHLKSHFNAAMPTRSRSLAHKKAPHKAGLF